MVTRHAAVRLPPQAEYVPALAGHALRSDARRKKCCLPDRAPAAPPGVSPRYAVLIWFRVSAVADHFRIAENSGDDVVEVMRNATGQQSDHLHATSPFQSRRSFALSRSRNSRSMALATASPASRTIDSGNILVRIGRKASKPMMLRTRPGRVKRHACPGTRAGGRQRVLQWTGRQGCDIGNGDAVRFGRGLLGQC